MRSSVFPGLLCVALFACGTPATPCDVGSCPFGCCDAKGACQAPASNTCGTQGNACTACAFGQGCQFGACVSGSGTGGGTTTGGGAGGGTGTGGGSGGTATFTAYRLTTQAVNVPASCFWTVPPSTALPGRTIEVLVWNQPGQRLLAIKDLATVVLGDSTPIRFPQAIQGSTLNLDFAFMITTRTPVSDAYDEARQTQAAFHFDALGAAPTGALNLNSQFACVQGRQSCPALNTLRESKSCSLSVPFTATSIAIDPAYFQPTTPITGAQRYLSAWDFQPVKQVSTPSCFRNNTLPAGRGDVSEQNTRALVVLQVVPPTPVQGNCSSSNCAGCCTPGGVCEQGSTVDACGTQGARCSVCQGFGNTCTLGSCMFPGAPLGARTLSLDGMQLQLGDAPLIATPDDLGWLSPSFVWTGQRETSGAGYREVRQARANVPFPEGSGPSAGVARFDADYACIRGTAPCPTGSLAAVDAANCSASVPFVAAPAP